MTADRAPHVLEHLRSRHEEMANVLRALEPPASPGDDPRTPPFVCDALADQLDEIGYRSRRVGGTATAGGHLFARPATRTPGKPVQLVLGHVGSAPHGGLVQLVFALSCIEQLGLDPPATIVVFVDSGEELGGPESRRWIVPLAQLAARAFVLEGATDPTGPLDEGREGVGHYLLRARGRAAHAGLDPENGVSAVLELSYQIQRLFALNDPDEGIAVNVGTIDGGLRANVIAPEASAHVDAVVETQEQAELVDGAIRNLAPVNAEVELDVEGGFGSPTTERTAADEALRSTATDAARELGLPLGAAMDGGATGGRLTTPYTATLDGLGPIGGPVDPSDEQMMIEAMPEHSALLALLLTSPLGPPEEENR